MLLAMGSPSCYAPGQNLGTGQDPGLGLCGASLPQSPYIDTASDILKGFKSSISRYPLEGSALPGARFLGYWGEQEDMAEVGAWTRIPEVFILDKLNVSKLHCGVLHWDYIIYGIILLHT